jgi:hypothetical protein
MCLIASSLTDMVLQILKLKTTLKTSGKDSKTTLKTSGKDSKTTLKTSGKDSNNTPKTSVKNFWVTYINRICPKGYPQMLFNYTRNEWKRLEFCGILKLFEDLCLERDRVRSSSPLETSVKDVEWAIDTAQSRLFMIFFTRFECSFTSSPLVSSVFLHLPHSFRVYFYIFSTRFECSFSSCFESQLPAICFVPFCDLLNHQSYGWSTRIREDFDEKR